jgi:hypothetical protein
VKNVFYPLALKAFCATIPFLICCANTSHSQQPSPEEQKNCKECKNNCVEFQTIPSPDASLPLPVCNQKLPKAGPWSFDLQPGEWKIKDGVLYGFEPREDRHPVILGLPDITAKEEESLIKLTAGITEDPPLKTYEVWRNLAIWFAEYYGDKACACKEKTEDCEEKQEELRQRLECLYTEKTDQYIQLEEQERTTEVPQNEKEKYRNRAELFADLLEKERKIFKDFPDAQESRYGRKLIGPVMGVEFDHKTVAETLLSFISGKYIQEENKQAEEETKKAQQVSCEPSSKNHAEIGSRTGYIQIVPGPPVPKNGLPRDGSTWKPEEKCTGQNSYMVETTIEEPCLIGIETRIFVAEHPPFHNRVLQWLGLYHTSILAGRWEVFRSVVERGKVDCEREGAKPKMTRYCEQEEKIEKKFYKWYLVNCCSGDYFANDELRLVDCEIFIGENSLQESAEYLSGTSPQDHGRRCKSRYGAYPKGDYGINWVCHQAANAFAHTKWKFTPVLYYPIIFYSFMGNKGISDVTTDKCPETHACLPCVSGARCCGQSSPAGFKGLGYNLQRGWHPTRGKWINTDFQYEELPIINTCEWDDYPRYNPMHNRGALN